MISLREDASIRQISTNEKQFRSILCRNIGSPFLSAASQHFAKLTP